MDNIYVIVDGELYHHGIKGMKWGRRRFQNKDGSLTPAGEKRYNDGDGSSALDRWKANREAKRSAKAQAKAESDARKKAVDEAKAYEQGRVKGMTDDDVYKAIARSQLEERYNQQVRNKDANEGSYRNKSVKDMNDEELARAIERSRMEQTYRQMNPEKVSAGKAIATKFLNEAVVPAAVNAGRSFLEKAIGKMTDNLIGKDVDELAALKREFDIEDYKKKIHDLKNPKEDISDTINRLKKEQELSDLTDTEYQQLKKDAQKAAWRKVIGKDDAAGDDSTSTSKNSQDSDDSANPDTKSDDTSPDAPSSKGRNFIAGLLGPAKTDTDNTPASSKKYQDRDADDDSDDSKESSSKSNKLADIEGTFVDKSDQNGSSSTSPKPLALPPPGDKSPGAPSSKGKNFISGLLGPAKTDTDDAPASGKKTSNRDTDDDSNDTPNKQSQNDISTATRLKNTAGIHFGDDAYVKPVSSTDLKREKARGDYDQSDALSTYKKHVSDKDAKKAARDKRILEEEQEWRKEQAKENRETYSVGNSTWSSDSSVWSTDSKTSKAKAAGRNMISKLLGSQDKQIDDILSEAPSSKSPGKQIKDILAGSKATVSRIKSMKNSGKSVAVIAKQLGISESAVRDLLNS